MVGHRHCVGGDEHRAGAWIREPYSDYVSLAQSIGRTSPRSAMGGESGVGGIQKKDELVYPDAVRTIVRHISVLASSG